MPTSGPNPAKIHVDEVALIDEEHGRDEDGLIIERHDADKMEQVTSPARGLVELSADDEG